MKKNKLQQIICAGTIVATAINLTPSFAINDEAEAVTSCVQQLTNLRAGTPDNGTLDDEDIDEEGEDIKYGKLIVKHIDIDTGKEITKGDFYNEIAYGEFTVSSRLNISGYVLQDASEKTVVISDNNPIATVIFKYKSTKPATKPDTDTGSNDTEKPSTDSTQKPSIDNVQKPNVDGSQKPSTGGTQKPSTDNAQKPSTGGTQKPSTDNAQKPSTGGTQKPSTGEVQKPSANDSQKPETELNKEEVKTAGTVTINYVDINSGEVFKTIKKTDLRLSKKHTFSAGSVDGYTLLDSSSQVVLLTKENPNVTIIFKYVKNESKARFGMSRLRQSLEENKEFTVYYDNADISISKDLMKDILETKEEELELNLNDSVADMKAIEEFCSINNSNMLSAFTISSNIDLKDSDGKITIVKEIDKKYNGKTVYLYKISDNKVTEYVDENAVVNGNVSFDTKLSSVEYFISDTKVEKVIQNTESAVVDDTNSSPEEGTLEIEEVNQVVEEKSSFSIGYIITAAIGVLAFGIGLAQLFKNKDEDKKPEK